MPKNRKVLYKGATFDTDLSKGFKRTDSDLIKIDLLNHLFTRKGERAMMPNFGTSLQDLLFEPLDELLKTRIANEIQSVVDYDPRIELLSLSVVASEDENSLTCDLLIRFIELEVIDNLNIDLQLG